LIWKKGAPQITLNPPSILMRFGRVFYEKFWLYSHF